LQTFLGSRRAGGRSVGRASRAIMATHDLSSRESRGLKNSGDRYSDRPAAKPDTVGARLESQIGNQTLKTLGLWDKLARLSR
jgi:hypothetical protein